MHYSFEKRKKKNRESFKILKEWSDWALRVELRCCGCGRVKEESFLFATLCPDPTDHPTTSQHHGFSLSLRDKQGPDKNFNPLAIKHIAETFRDLKSEEGSPGSWGDRNFWFVLHVCHTLSHQGPEMQTQNFYGCWGIYSLILAHE